MCLLVTGKCFSPHLPIQIIIIPICQIMSRWREISILLRDYGSATPDTVIVKYRAGRLHRGDPLSSPTPEDDLLAAVGLRTGSYEERDNEFFEVKSFTSIDKIGGGWVSLVTQEEVTDAHEVCYKTCT